MFKLLINFKYKFHLLLQNYNEALIQDALCEKLKASLQQKASYHEEKAGSLIARL
ncbi:hypothetical protein [Mesobacillus jeotgali]|uniref:hypothetical protein n=1 Tax=Mesobacillus jeotgali TaxID=129985 RepID=UPI0015921B55|nr:hypothetical protein [Mesobacillus jeotgali]